MGKDRQFMARNRKALRIVADRPQLAAMRPDQRPLCRRPAGQRNAPAARRGSPLRWPDLIGQPASAEPEASQRTGDRTVVGMGIGDGRTDQQVDLPLPSQRTVQRHPAPVRCCRQPSVREPQKGNRIPPNAEAAKRMKALPLPRCRQSGGRPCHAVRVRCRPVTDHDHCHRTTLPPQRRDQRRRPNHLVIGMGGDDHRPANVGKAQLHSDRLSRPD